MQHLRNDIAVITLAKPVVLSDRVSTVCLPQEGQAVPTGTKCYITGTPTVYQKCIEAKSRFQGAWIQCRIR